MELESVSLSRRAALAGLSSVALLPALPSLAAARRRGPQHATEFGTFIDRLIRSEMEREQIPGAAFVFVKDSRIFYIKGYGVADIERNVPVDPLRTIFRIGSVSKLFAATALVQLADRGRLLMNADVNRYLTRLTVAETWPSPVTPAHLLSHTAGFDEIRPGTQAPSEDQVQPLGEFLRDKLVRIRSPGEIIAYSTYGITLAGLLVEEVSGKPFEQYLTDHVWRPLQMQRTNISVPLTLRSDLAGCYELADGRNHPSRWEWYHTTPASSINSTAGDMARFMIAMLAQGRIGRARILSAASVREMQRTKATGHPRLPGVAWGFFEEEYQGLRILEHGGNVGGYNCQLSLFPEQNAGLFIVAQHENSGIRDTVKWSLLERYYAAPRPPAAPIEQPVPSAELQRFAGIYGWNTYCYTCQPRRPPFVTLQVEARPDGTLGLNGRRWIRADPLLFVREDGRAKIAFRTDRNGHVAHMFAGAFWVFDRMPSEPA